MTVPDEKRYQQWAQQRAEGEEVIRALRKNVWREQTGDFEYHVIETGATGTCLCGHPSSHHTPPAVAERRCERSGCTCRVFTNENGVAPVRRVSKVKRIIPFREPTIEEQLRASLDRQLLAIGYNVQDAIERLYSAAPQGVKVSFLGGPYSGMVRTLKREAERVEIKGEKYVLIHDPDTGESLRAYAWEQKR